MNKNIYLNKFADWSINPNNWNWVRDYAKPWLFKNDYKNKLLQNNQFGNFISRAVSDSIANEFNSLSLPNKLMYIYQKIMQYFGFNLDNSNFAKKFDNYIMSKYTPKEIANSFSNKSYDIHKMLINKRNERMKNIEPGKSFDKDPYSEANINATFGGEHNTLPSTITSNIIFNKIRPALYNYINNTRE